MAQREKEETEVRVTETLTLTLCVNNCGLYGNPTTNNMCQACFHSKIRPSTSGSGQSMARSDPIRPLQEEAAAEAKAEAKAAEAEVKRGAAAGRRAVNRCLECGKRVGLTGFRCRCGDLFCGDHRYSDRHGCGFDYKAVGRERIQKENPVVRAAKIVRI